MIDTNEIKDRLHKCDVRELEDYIYHLCDEIDRLRGEKQTPPQGKTVDVKIPVIVTPEGKCHGYDYLNLEPGCTRFWLTATLPVPAEVEVVAEVSDD